MMKTLTVSTLTIEQCTDYLVDKLLRKGFVVQRYNAYSSQSVYLKLDYGVANSIRISDHKSKKQRLHYRYNIGPGIREQYTDKRGEYPRYFYPIEDIDELISNIVGRREYQIAKLQGIDRYYMCINHNKHQNQNTAGFWSNAFLCALKENDNDKTTA